LVKQNRRRDLRVAARARALEKILRRPEAARAVFLLDETEPPRGRESA
jgi:hypothetical protein